MHVVAKDGREWTIRKEVIWGYYDENFEEGNEETDYISIIITAILLFLWNVVVINAPHPGVPYSFQIFLHSLSLLPLLLWVDNRHRKIIATCDEEYWVDYIRGAGGSRRAMRSVAKNLRKYGVIEELDKVY